MNFSIKPPLYALDTNQINDLLYAENINSNLAEWLRKIDHFPIEKRSLSGSNTGLLLFERFTPWFDNWCDNYTTKLYNFYKYISQTSLYTDALFNGYGLLDNNYGDMLQNAVTYDFNIPSSLILFNPTQNPISITFLQRSYESNQVYFNRIYSNVDIYAKRVIRIESLSAVQIPTENILFCSMVLNAVGILTPNDIGIPPGLDYSEFDNHIDNIKNIIDFNYTYLHKKIAQIDYKLIATNGGHYNATTGNLTVDLNYETEYISGTLILENVPSWYYSAALIYGNYDYWDSNLSLKEDLGKQLSVTILEGALEYGFLEVPPRPEISSNVINETIFPDGMSNIISNRPQYIKFCYREGVGIHLIWSSDNNTTFSESDKTFIERDSFVDIDDGISLGEDFTYSLFLFTHVAVTGWTNTGFCLNFSPVLFSEVDGLASAYNSLIVTSTRDFNDSDPENVITTFTSEHGLSRFVCHGNYHINSNNLTLSIEERNQAVTDYLSGTLTGSYFSNFFFTNESTSGSFFYTGLVEDNGQLESYFEKENQRTNVDYEIIKTLIFTTHSSDPRTIRNNTDQEIIDFVNNTIIPSYEDNEFMPDSLRIIEIHEALNAGKFANDPANSEVFRFANLGYYIERIARVLGISVDPDGSIRSVRQRAYKDAGDTIPAGWPIGQWGRNQGGSNDGQKGGNVEDDKDGITYPVISNKFTLDEFTGEPNKIVEGGYVLCENIIQYLETFKDDLDKALGLQYAGANSFPLPQGNGDVSFEGLSILLQENTYMISQLSRLISSAQISSLVTQAVVTELLAHCGVPTTIKELKVQVGADNEVSIPYPAITEGSPSQFDQTLLLLANLSPLLGGKITIRQDQRNEDAA